MLKSPKTFDVVLGWTRKKGLAMHRRPSPYATVMDVFCPENAAQVLFGGTPPTSSSTKSFNVIEVDPLWERTAPVGLKEFGEAVQKFVGSWHGRIVIG